MSCQQRIQDSGAHESALTRLIVNEQRIMQAFKSLGLDWDAEQVLTYIKGTDTWQSIIGHVKGRRQAETEARLLGVLLGCIIVCVERDREKRAEKQLPPLDSWASDE